MAEQENQQNQVTQPAPAVRPVGPTGSKLERFKHWYSDNKKLSVPATVLLVILLLAALPLTRYAAAGLVLKKDVSVRVVDDTAGTPVSGADVSVGSVTAQTNGSGVALLKHVKAGNHRALVSKKYYKDGSLKFVAPILKQKSIPQIKLSATGRQVKLTITDLIDKHPLDDVDIAAAGVTAKTDASGSAILVLPAGTVQQKAKLSHAGYNDSEVTLKVSSDNILNNPFALAPAGKLYFLSKLSGKIDVVKTNLDGSDRQTVLAGTGSEDQRNTVLLASRDWKYLALLSKRAGATPTLYLIDTSNDSTAVIESGNSNLTLTGWAGDNFIYTISRGDVQLWQSGQQVIKSFNAPTKKSVVLDQTTASGTDNLNYLGQQVGSVYAYEDQVFYIMNWSASYGGSYMDQLSAKQATFNSIKPDGSAKKAIRSFGLAAGASASGISLDNRVKSPDAVELHLSDGTGDKFYVYANGEIKDDQSMDINSYYGSIYPTYLLSPSGSRTFWSEPRDGKNTLFVGDSDGQNGKQIASLSDYNTYGWYSDNYLLVSKNSSELYVMGRDGKQTPVKVSDYHKPDLSFAGYGGGYGGL